MFDYVFFIIFLKTPLQVIVIFQGCCLVVILLIKFGDITNAWQDKTLRS